MIVYNISLSSWTLGSLLLHLSLELFALDRALSEALAEKVLALISSPMACISADWEYQLEVLFVLEQRFFEAIR
jgi:hypothetical protein